MENNPSVMQIYKTLAICAKITFEVTDFAL